MARPKLLQRLESRLLLVVFAAAAALWAFLALGGEVQEGETLALDRRLLLMLRQPGDPSQPIGSQTFQESMRDVTALGGVTVLTLVTIVATLALIFHKRWRQAWIFLATVLIAQVASGQLKSLYGRPRPELVPHGSYVYSASFPSGHSMLSAAVYLTLAMMIASLEPRRPTKVLVFVLATAMMVAIGFSRVYLAVHWPSDVLAGWCAGAGLAALAWAAMGWTGARAKGRG